MPNNTKTRSNRLVYIKGRHPSDSSETAWQGMANPPQYIEQKEKDKMKKVSKYRIEKGVTIPRPRNSELIEAVEAMGIGESFEFEADKRQQCYAASKYREYEVTIRKVDEESCRVWRTG